MTTATVNTPNFMSQAGRANIAANSTPPSNPNPTPPQEPKEPSMIDKIVDRTFIGANYTASAIGGALGGAAGVLRGSWVPAGKLTGSFVKNLIKTETVGPNLKIIGTLAAVPLAGIAFAVGAGVSVLAGVWQGVKQVDTEKPREFSVGAATGAGYNSVKNSWAEIGKEGVESMNEWGNEKLGEGEKPFDIPLIKTGKTLLMGAVGAAVGGAAGVVAGTIGAVREVGAGVWGALTDDKVNVFGKVYGAVGATVGGVVHGGIMGVSTAVGTFLHGMGETWDKDSMIQGGKQVFGDAFKSVYASAMPVTAMFEEVPVEK